MNLIPSPAGGEGGLDYKGSTYVYVKAYVKIQMKSYIK